MKLLLAITLLAGCSSPPPPAAPTWKEKARQIKTQEEERQFCIEAARAGRLEDVCRPRVPHHQDQKTLDSQK